MSTDLHFFSLIVLSLLCSTSDNKKRLQWWRDVRAGRWWDGVSDDIICGWWTGERQSGRHQRDALSVQSRKVDKLTLCTRFIYGYCLFHWPPWTRINCRFNWECSMFINKVPDSFFDVWQEDWDLPPVLQRTQANGRRKISPLFEPNMMHTKYCILVQILHHLL